MTRNPGKNRHFLWASFKSNLYFKIWQQPSWESNLQPLGFRAASLLTEPLGLFSCGHSSWVLHWKTCTLSSSIKTHTWVAIKLAMLQLNSLNSLMTTVAHLSLWLVKYGHHSSVLHWNEDMLLSSKIKTHYSRLTHHHSQPLCILGVDIKSM